MMAPDILSLLLSFAPLILIVTYLRMLSRRDWISHYILNGVRCYSCKDEIIKMDDDYFNNLKNLESSNKNVLRLCQSCERDNNIDILFSKKRGRIILFLKKISLSEKYRKIHQKVSIGCVCLPILGIVLRYGFNMNNHLTDISNMINLVIWTFMIFHLKITTIKKIK